MGSTLQNLLIIFYLNANNLKENRTISVADGREDWNLNHIFHLEKYLRN